MLRSLLHIPAPASTLIINSTTISGSSAGDILTTDGTKLQEGGNVKATSLALGGATIGSNQLAVTGSATIGSSLAIFGATIGTNALAVTGTVEISSTVKASAGLFTSIEFQTGGVSDAYIIRPASDSFQLGKADAAAPALQTLQVQSVVAGTVDTAGADWTFKASKSTGTGVGGNIIFKTSPAALLTGDTQNTLVPSLIINSNGLINFGDKTASYPALKRFLTTLICRLGDDTLDAPFQASSFLINNATILAGQSTGYGTPTNTAKKISFDASTITLPDLAAAVGQLILDLQAGNMPAA